MLPFSLMFKRKGMEGSDGPLSKSSSRGSSVIAMPLQPANNSTNIPCRLPSTKDIAQGNKLEETVVNPVTSKASPSQPLIFSPATAWENIFSNVPQIKKLVQQPSLEEPKVNQQLPPQNQKKDEKDENVVSERDFKCPYCSKLLLPPIRLCLQGHSICSVCATKVAHCPTCKYPLLDSGRNQALEKLVDELVIGCNWKHRGCTNMFKAKDRDMHYKLACDYVPFKCLLCNCWVDLADFETHYESCMNGRFKVVHKTSLIADKVSNTNIFCYTIEYDYLKNNYISFCKLENHGIFVFRLKKSHAQVHIYCAVVRCMKKVKAYSCTIKVGHGNSGPVLDYSGPINSFLRTEPEILNAGFHISVPLDVMKKTAGSEGICPVMYTIKSNGQRFVPQDSSGVFM